MAGNNAHKDWALGRLETLLGPLKDATVAVLGLGPIRRDFQECCELPDLADIVALGVRAELPDRHVFDHATA